MSIINDYQGYCKNHIRLFSEKIETVTHLLSNPGTFVVCKNPKGSSCGCILAFWVYLEDYFSQEWSQTLPSLREHRKNMLVDLLWTSSVLCILTYGFLIVLSHIARFGDAV